MEGKECGKGLVETGGGKFVSEGSQFYLSLTNEGVSWKSDGGETSYVEWTDVIRCHRGQVSDTDPLRIPEDVPEKDPSFTLHFMEKNKDHLWKHRHKTFQSEDTDSDLTSILQVIQRKSVEDHPRRLLVLINPVGGTGTGQKHYSKTVAPLFKLAQIDTDVIVTKDSKHLDEIGGTYDYSSVDGVVILGGDGTCQRMIHAWLPRIQRDAGIDMTNPDITLKSNPCPIGMIPTGTGNGLARRCYGCVDVQTAALNIIAGRKTLKNLLSVTNEGRHVGFVSLIIGNGFCADVLDVDAKYRWLGWLRYPIGFVMSIVKSRREFMIHLEYRPVKSETTDPSKTTSESNENQDWVSVDGLYTGVHCLPAMFRKDETSEKMKSAANANGATLVLEKQCGKIKYLKWLLNFGQYSADMFDADFLTVVEVTSYRLKIVPRDNQTEWHTDKERCYCIDGETLRFDSSDIYVRNHPNMMQAFGTSPLTEKICPS